MDFPDARKIQRLRPGLNPRTRVPVVSMLTTRPPKPSPQQYILDSDNEPTEKREKTPEPSTSTDADFTADLQFNEFHQITQEELNDLIRDLEL